MTPLSDRFNHVLERIRQAEQLANRVGQVQLLAVSKTQTAATIRAAYALGQRHFGESYCQEAQQKIAALADLQDIIWHFIGPLQANKTRAVATYCHWVHSVDRLKIARRLNAQRPAALPPLNICLQVKLSDEVGKSGVLPTDLPALATAVASLPRLQLRGLMTLPAPTTDPRQQRQPFKRLAQQLLVLQTAAWLHQQQAGSLDTLSMGMTGDFEAAILAGATFVRVGTALFGPRTPLP